MYHTTDEHTQPTKSNTSQVNGEQYTSQGPRSSARFVHGATSSGDHRVGVHLYTCEEKDGHKSVTTNQVKNIGSLLWLSDYM